MRPDLRVLVVDDDFRVAGLHAKVVDTMAGLTTVGSTRTLAEARKLVAAGPVDLALVDVYLPDGSGLDLVRELRCDAFILGAADDAAIGLARGPAERAEVHRAVRPRAQRLARHHEMHVDAGEDLGVCRRTFGLELHLAAAHVVAAARVVCPPLSLHRPSGCRC